MKEVKSTVNVGPGEDLTIFQEVGFQDEVVFRQEGDSVLYPFLYELMFLFTDDIDQYNRDSFDPGLPYSGNYDFSGNRDIYRVGTYTDGTNDPYIPVSGLSGGSPMTVNLTNQDIRQNDRFSAPDSQVNGIVLAGVQGNDALLGYHPDVTRINRTTYEIQGVSSNGSEDVSRAFACVMWDKSAGRSFKDYSGAYTGEHYGSTFRNPQIVLGRNGDPNVFRQFALNDLIPGGAQDNRLQYNPMTVNEPNINLTQQISTTSMSREVDNQGNVDIPIGELALYTDYRWDVDFDRFGYNYHCVSRDTLATSVPSGSVVSFTFKFRTSSQDTGGIMTNFNEMLYRHLANTNRTARDINNSDKSHGADNQQFDVRSRDGHLDRLTGVQVGTSTQVVDEADTSLISRVPYGEQDGELFPVGSWVDKMVMDDVNNKAYFQISRIFENRGSTSIDLNEMGLYTNGPSGLVMVFRHQLGSTQTVASGENVKATYQVSVTI